MKDAYYFPHDSNSRNDQKIIEIRSNYGMRGYGVYFGIIEILREANGYQLPTNYKAIAYDLREDEEIIKNVIEGFDLFKISGENFFSKSLKERMKKMDEIREKRRESGRLGGEANAKQMLKQNSSDAEAVKESKVKESKEENIKYKDTPKTPPLAVQDKPEKVRELSELQKIVKGWKLITEIPVKGPESTDWDKVHFARNAKSAKSLLTLFGYEGAVECMAFVYNYMKDKKLDCTLETVVKRSDLYREKMGESVR